MGKVLAFPAREDRLFSRSPLDELTGLIGFKNGSLALYLAGFRTIGAIFNSSQRDILSVPGIGRSKLFQIKHYFQIRGLEYPQVRSQRTPGQLEMPLAV